MGIVSYCWCFACIKKLSCEVIRSLKSSNDKDLELALEEVAYFLKKASKDKKNSSGSLAGTLYELAHTPLEEIEEDIDEWILEKISKVETLCERAFPYDFYAFVKELLTENVKRKEKTPIGR